MNLTDNDDNLFQFDPYEPHTIPAPLRSASPVMSQTASSAQDPSIDNDDKGEGPSSPLPVPSGSRSRQIDDMEDVFRMSFDDTPPWSLPPIVLTADSHDPSSASPSTVKTPETHPDILPHAFSPPGLGYGSANWPSPPGPSSPEASSFDSTAGSTRHPWSANASPTETTPQSVAHVSRTIPPRRRSTSSLPSAKSTFHAKQGSPTNGKSSNLARRFLLRKKVEIELDYPSITTLNSCPVPWRTDASTPAIHTCLCPTPCIVTPTSNVNLRPNSSPLLVSALDLAVLSLAQTKTAPSLTPPVRDVFRDVLPKEIHLHILWNIVVLDLDAQHRAETREEWTVNRASSSRHRWVGVHHGLRELIKLSRVSKSWQALVFDGQLWETLDLRAFPQMPKSTILRLSSIAGPFITRMDISFRAQLSPSSLLDLTHNLCVRHAPDMTPYTQLTSLNLRGCKAVNTRSLHHVLIRSPSLRKLCLRGVTAVTNGTWDILAVYCRELVTLDLSRCAQMNADGLRNYAAAWTSRGEHALLVELRLAALKHVTDRALGELGRAAPHLEILDLSYCLHLHNSALDSFVACSPGDDFVSLGLETVLLHPGDLGRESMSLDKCMRRVTRLRHLSLSNCPLLTDIACSNLAHSVPSLEFLELAGMDDDLRDDGLVRLLSTTPRIRRLDLEDATSITDKVLRVLTPSEDTLQAEPGHFLEHLVISYCGKVTDSGLLALIGACKCLKVLEADNTRIGAPVVREFVKRNRERSSHGARLVVVDCRGVSESLVKDLSSSTRPRIGWRAHEARKLKYLDGRDRNAEDLKIGQDECDQSRVVLKSFYSWQTVDAVHAAREKRRRSTTRRRANDSSSESELSDSRLSTVRWWNAGGRRSGWNSPVGNAEVSNLSDGCHIM